MNFFPEPLCTDAIAAAIRETTRRLSASIPPPKGAPYFALDHLCGGGMEELKLLSESAIFRKYAVVLELGSKFGAAARWLVLRFGCRVVGIDSAAAAAAATALTRRASLTGQVHFAAGKLEMIPVRGRTFTHAWMIEPQDSLVENPRVWREAFRCLRPGGHLALQLRTPSRPSALLCLLTEAGFIRVTVRDITGQIFSEPHVLATAWQRFEEVMRERCSRDEKLQRCWDRLRECKRRTREENMQAVHIFARRPS